MNQSTKIIAGVVAVAVIGGGIYAATSHKSTSSTDTSKAATLGLVLDVGGVDDHSFNQSAWEGAQAYAKKNNLKSGQNAPVTYFNTADHSDLDQNFNLATKSKKYTIVYGIGYSLNQSITKSAKLNPKQKFVLVDDIVKSRKNVASVMFRSEQSSYLAGVAAATKADANGEKTVGFIGGIHGNIIDAFDAGFEAGVKATDSSLKVEKQYANSFTDSAKGKTIAATMYASGIRTIFAAAGFVGNGAFSEATAENAKLNADSKERLYIIGVDRDQKSDGAYTSKDGKKTTSTLASSITSVGDGVKNVADNYNKTKKFPGGKTIAYGLKEHGVYLTDSELTSAEKKAVNKAKKAIINGKIKVPNHPKGSEFNQKF
ncbi:BMP family ABC transporter substrate-binding protein [Leuconostoc pseudomesenteroides]|uniref:BMP family lipoprotein n=1 Tax=Leuconostoc falkenbergense TaxID=2766470 RepID=UPI0009FD5A5C|nr:BMP family ABC transporter substrate-binding protein [Leuconostoc pseudomesenteroides]ORI56201.1 BMP family ABC transporter substrate-binding protein [Leuconostoc pseudomesenteroides]ORI77238.1 BMP family ABC transporter substrate-binding protein [Leuconostoc pseudomesenteroides]ORI84011.1 BMP family ABC transporter substrate-binding protein [Leuconostoc pseudomesenteroides]